jgi:aryl-alcohol dehydrogenase-like predicted oxidoreductase
VSKRNAEFRSQQKRVNHRKVQQAPHPAIIRLGTNVADRAAICSAILAARRRICTAPVDPARLKAETSGRSPATERCLVKRRSDVMAAETTTGEIEMERAILAGTSLEVSRVALGTWAIGGWMWGGTDEAESIATIRAAVERGINLIDTAPAYGFGRSEEIVGKALAEGSLRSRVLIATKVGLEWRSGKVFRNATRARILQEVEDSLRRLRTDHIDVYQVHWPDTLVTIEETAEAMHTLFEQGKIRAIGVSNFSVGQMERFRRVAPLHVLQPPYNLFERGIEADILPYCRKNKIATFGYGALCRGLLSAFRGVSRCRGTARSIRPATLPQARDPPGDSLDARSRHHHRTVGRAPSRPARTGRRGERLAARCSRQGRDRSHPERRDQRPGWSRIHGAAGEQRCRVSNRSD